MQLPWKQVAIASTSLLVIVELLRAHESLAAVHRSGANMAAQGLIIMPPAATSKSSDAPPITRTPFQQPGPETRPSVGPFRLPEYQIPRYDAEPDLDYHGCIRNCQARNVWKNDSILDEDGFAPCAKRHWWWCRKWFSPDNLDGFCHGLCINQYPPNCSTRHFMVLKDESDVGLGASMHLQLMVLSLALKHNRTFIYSDSIVSHWTHAGQPGCASRSYDCYWLPITNCALPKDWKARSVTISDKNSPVPDKNQFVQCLPTAVLPGNIYWRSRVDYPCFSNLHNVHRLWFMAQFISFLYRPNDYALQKLIRPTLRKTFESFQSLPNMPPNAIPLRLLATFMRAGDKYHESRVFSPAQYWCGVQSHAARYNITHLYIGSDSHNYIKEFTEILVPTSRQNFKVFYIDVHRRPQGSHERHMREEVWHTPAVVDLMRTALSDMFIAQHATAWFGTLTSNVGRLQNEVRGGNGRYGSAFMALDDES